MKKYRVLEQHLGDKQYWPGDTRELIEPDAAPLIGMGLIAEADEPDPEAAAKAEAEAAAKAEAEAAAKAEAEAAAKAEAEAAAKAPAKTARKPAQKADGGDLLDKAESVAPQNKGNGSDNA